ALPPGRRGGHPVLAFSAGTRVGVARRCGDWRQPNDIFGAYTVTIQTLDAPRMGKAERKGTARSEHVRELIEEGIATGRFPPGMRLDEVELADRFNVSRTPLREALFQLAAAGIVEMQPRRGTVVAEVSPHRMVEMFEVMAELEAMCGRLAARRMLAPEHERLLAAHRACENAREANNP